MTDWMAFAELEPFGEERADLRAGIIAAVIANANRDQKRQRRPFTPRDFMPRFGQDEQTDDEMLTVATAWVKALGGQDLRKNAGAS